MMRRWRHAARRAEREICRNAIRRAAKDDDKPEPAWRDMSAFYVAIDA